MDKISIQRAEALALLKKYNQNENLLKHALAVEAVMLHFADLSSAADRGKWGVIGLVHDIDYEKYPEDHCKMAREILAGENWPEEYIRAIESHGWKICTYTEPLTKLEKVLYTIDELTGLIAATTLMRPNKSIMDLEVKSVKKKWKQSSFAAGVNREVIAEGAAMLEMDIEFIITETIKGMQNAADAIGLRGVE